MASIFDRMRSLARRGGSRRFVAIDFDSRRLRLVQAERGGDRLKILQLAGFAMPADIDLSDVEVLGGFIGQCLQSCGWRGANLLMSVPRGQAVLKPVSLPPNVQDAEIAGMVQYQMETELPFSPDDAVIDFTRESHYGVSALPEESAAPGVDVLVAAVQRPVVEHFSRLAQIAGGRLLRLGLRPYADGKCLEACTVRRPQECTAIVHMTADETEIDILAGGATVFSRSAVVKVPTGSPDEPEADLAGDGIVVEVSRSLRSFQAVQGSRRIDSLVVAGGTGLEPRVVAELGKRLDTPCRMFSPVQALGLGSTDEDASAFMSALGLVIGHAGLAELPFDFLHPKRPRVQRNRKKVIAVCVGAGAAVLLVAGVAAGTVYLQAKQSRINILTQELKGLEVKNKEVAAVGKPVNAIDGWLHAGRPWLDHWAMLSGVFPSCTDAYVTGLSATQDGVLNFNVKARSSEAVTDLGRRLADAGYGFKPGQVATRGDPLGYTFNVGMKVFVKPDAKVDLAGVKFEPRPADDSSSTAGASERPRPFGATGRPPRPSAAESTAPAAAPATAPAAETPAEAPAEKPARPRRFGSTEQPAAETPAEAPAEKPARPRRFGRTEQPAGEAPAKAPDAAEAPAAEAPAKPPLLVAPDGEKPAETTPPKYWGTRPPAGKGTSSGEAGKEAP